MSEVSAAPANGAVEPVVPNPSTAPVAPVAPVGSASAVVDDPIIAAARSQLEIMKANGFAGTDDYKQVEADILAAEALLKGVAPAAPAAQAPVAPVAPAGAPAPGSTEALASMFFGKIDGGDGKVIEFKELKEVNEYMVNQLGLSDIKADDPNSISVIIQKAKDWKNGASIKSELEGRIAAIEQDLSNLPDPIYKSMLAWGQGQDWKAPLSSLSTAIDFSADPNSIDKTVLLNKYFPGEFDEAALKENGPLVAKAEALAKRQFEADKKIFESERRSILAAAESKRLEVQSSVSSSVENLKKEFSALDDKYVRQVEDMLKKGDFNALFYEQNGVYKQDAAKRLALALVGEQEINNLLNALKKRTEVAQQIVGSGNTEMPRPGAQQQSVTTAGNGEVAKEAAKYFSQSPYDSRPQK